MRTSATMSGWLCAVAIAGAVSLAACTTSSRVPATRSHPAAQAPAAAAADGCSFPVLNEKGPDHDDGKLILGIIAIGDAPWPTVPVHQGRWRYWQKDGLDIRSGHQTVTITVPKDWRNRAAITWGVNVGIVSTLRLPGCDATPGSVNGYAGGFYLRSRSACVPLVFSIGRRSAVVRIGVGRHCTAP